MKRRKVGLLALLVLMLFVAACGGGNNVVNNDPTPTPDAKPNEAAASPEPKEPVKFSVFVNADGLPTPDKDRILQQLNTDLNMDMAFTASSAEYQQQLSVKIAGGTPPDVFQLMQTDLQAYADQGVLLELDQYLDKMPNVKATLSESDLSKTRYKGKLYAIPKRVSPPMNSFWVRKDWLDKLKLQPPTTPEELMNVAIAFTKNDPDGNNKNDTYGFTGTHGSGINALDGFLAAFGVARPGMWMVKDNQAVYTTTSPEMKQVMEYMNKLIASGAVDPELMLNKGLADQEKAFKGQAGILFRNWGELTKDEYVDAYKKLNPNAEWLQLDALTGPGGKFAGSFDISGTPGKFGISKSVEKDPDKLNKILEYFDYITGSGKGQMIVNYGVEGEHYKVENGTVVPLDKMSELGYAWMTQLTGRNEIEYLGVKFAKQKSYIDFAMNLPRHYVYREAVPVPEGVNIADRNTYELEEITKFMYGNRPLSEFDAFVKTLESTYQLPVYKATAEQYLKDIGALK